MKWLANLSFQHNKSAPQNKKRFTMNKTFLFGLKDFRVLKNFNNILNSKKAARRKTITNSSKTKCGSILTIGNLLMPKNKFFTAFIVLVFNSLSVFSKMVEETLWLR
ncbi:MAG: hypothetical protein R2764_06045 [Bacteroidales bacterium]